MPADPGPSLTLRRRLNAPPALVYAAWVRPEQLARWFGPAQTIQDSVTARMDVRVGGGFRIGFRTDDGDYHEVAGTYREVVENSRLVFTWAWHTTPERESLVTVSITGDAGQSTLTLQHERFFDDAARAGHERGWTGTLDKLQALFG
jgi:uncharacterized protein YndB with AHSA1/START domain